MAEKRMFSKKIIDTDWFMDMPSSSQNLYFHLSMRADDDGFVANPKRIIKLVGASEDDYKLLIAKSFIIPFESGLCVITDWRINNYLRADRYTETIYQEEKSQLVLDKNGKYNLGIPSGIPLVSIEKNRIDKNRIEKNRIEEEVCKKNLDNSSTHTLDLENNSSFNSENDWTNVGQCPDDVQSKEIKHKYGEYKNVLLTNNEVVRLYKDYGENETLKAIKFLDEYIEMKGAKYKSHNLALRNWVFKAVQEREQIKQKFTANKEEPKFGTRQYTKNDLDNLFDNLDDIQV